MLGFYGQDVSASWVFTRLSCGVKLPLWHPELGPCCINLLHQAVALCPLSLLAGDPSDVGTAGDVCVPLPVLTSACRQKMKFFFCKEKAISFVSLCTEASCAGEASLISARCPSRWLESTKGVCSLLPAADINREGCETRNQFWHLLR